jgi:ethanolamine utilization protein EutQ
MKKLVTAAEVEASIAGGQKVLYIDNNTIVTPAAVDAAREAGIEITVGTPQPEPVTENPAGEVCDSCHAPKSACTSCCNSPAEPAAPAASAAPAAPAPAASGNANIDLDVVYKVLSILKDKGLLNGVNPEDCPPVKGPVKPYSYQQDPSGMKIVDGATIQYDPLKTDDPANQVSYQEIVNADDGCRMNAGMISIENCRFGWKTESQEIYHVVEGTLTVKAGNKEYTAKPGDTVFFPEGVQVTFGSPDKMKAFYAAY